MTNIFRLSFGGAMTLFVLFIALFWCRHLYFPLAVEVSLGGRYDGPLGELISGLTTWTLLYNAAAIVAVFACALTLTRITTQKLIFGIRTHVSFIFYTMFSCGVVLAGAPLVVLLSALLIVRGSEKYVRGFARQPNYDLCFRGSFLIGAAGLLWLPATLFIVLTPLSMLLMNRDSREAVISLFTVVLPYAVTSYIYMLLGKGFATPVKSFASIFSLPSVFPGTIVTDIGVWKSVFIVLTLLMVVVSFIHLLQSKDIRFRQRRIFYYFLCFIPLCLAVTIFSDCGYSLFPLWAIPVATVMPLRFMRPGHSIWQFVIAAWMLVIVVAGMAPFFM